MNIESAKTARVAIYRDDARRQRWFTFDVEVRFIHEMNIFLLRLLLVL